MSKNKFHIKRVSAQEIRKIIDHCQPCGRFLAKEGSRWIAVDNSFGCAWIDEFDNKRRAVRWLQGKLAGGDQDRPLEPIHDSDALTAIAFKQGITLTEKEAAVILSYLEGHDYTLMANSTGAMRIHDNESGSSHQGDELYSIRQAIDFCSDMNAEMQEDTSPAQERNEEYLSGLREDERVLDGLMEKVWPTKNQEDDGNTVYTIVHTMTDIDKGIFVSPCARASYLSLAAARAEMELEIAEERALLDARYDHEERGSDYWEISQDGYGAAGFSRIEILTTKLHTGVQA